MKSNKSQWLGSPCHKKSRAPGHKGEGKGKSGFYGQRKNTFQNLPGTSKEKSTLSDREPRPLIARHEERKDLAAESKVVHKDLKWSIRDPGEKDAGKKKDLFRNRLLGSWLKRGPHVTCKQTRHHGGVPEGKNNWEKNRKSLNEEEMLHWGILRESGPERRVEYITHLCR